MGLFVNKPYADTIRGLRQIGYDGALLEEDYKFADWFSPQIDERRVAAAAFGQTPPSYDSACIGVVCVNGFRDRALVDGCRSLGAPLVLEIDRDEVREWAVARTTIDHGLVGRYPADRINQMFENRAQDWRPDSLLRAKHIGSFDWNRQLGLFAGLLPDLEQHIQEKLDPLLRSALSSTRTVYRERTQREPDPAQLFKLVFWILTAKVFHDRNVRPFNTVGADPDELLAAVARQYRTGVPILLNRDSRLTAFEHTWGRLDFRNLSVEALSQAWSTTLVDDDIKRQLGIHRTPRTLVRFMVERIPFEHSGDDKRIILEPCSGTAAFLVGVMDVLRQKLYGMAPAERHDYFVSHLAALEKDPFAVEIGRLALTLADFPNPGGWDIAQGDVFEKGTLRSRLRRAGVVLCNPPFEDFDAQERRHYKPLFTKKPAELLQAVLRDLNPNGVIGFVLPRNFLDGRGYAPIRKQLSERFATLDITVLPDRAFDSDSETALLIATDPIPHRSCRVVNRKVYDDLETWRQFEFEHKVSEDYAAEYGVQEAERSLGVPALPELWKFLVEFPTLGEVAELHRGIEWNRPLTKGRAETGHRSVFIRREPTKGYARGVAPRTKFDVFETPEMSFLSVRLQDQRTNAWRCEWNKPKAILNKSTRSRGRWRMAAFPDSEGVTCYQTFIGVWPKLRHFDEWTLAAVLNSPVANAFVATREGKTDITMETLSLTPVPLFSETQAKNLRFLIERYRSVTPSWGTLGSHDDPERMLKEIDALVLDAYGMPPRLQRQLLDFFRGHPRPTSHRFGDYVPADCDVYFSLSDFLAPEFQAATSGELLKRMAEG